MSSSDRHETARGHAVHVSAKSYQVTAHIHTQGDEMNTTDIRYIGDLGVSWCVKHHGVINEDTDTCDMLDEKYPGDDDLDDDGEFLPCVPRTLVYIAEPGDES